MTRRLHRVARDNGLWSDQCQYALLETGLNRRERAVVVDDRSHWFKEHIARHALLDPQWLRHLKSVESMAVLDANTIFGHLDDRSVCVWKLGDQLPSIGAQSRPGLLSAPIALAGQTFSENVTLDRHRQHAYFGIGDALFEVDLLTLQVAGIQRFPAPISVLSTSQGEPFTIGTQMGLHVLDPRLRVSCANFDHIQGVPLSIVHRDAHLIHVAGSFSSLINYDRRRPRRVQSTTYSGANLSSIASSSDQSTIIAVGAYKGKGSLEVYPFQRRSSELAEPPFRNRSMVSHCKCMSVISQGSHIVLSDSNGVLHWFEPGGSFPLRRRILSSGLMARKVLAVDQAPNSPLALWSGDRIGILRYGRAAIEEIEDEVEPEETFDAMMRTALQRQADEVRIISGLGFRP